MFNYLHSVKENFKGILPHKKVCFDGTKLLPQLRKVILCARLFPGKVGKEYLDAAASDPPLSLNLTSHRSKFLSLPEPLTPHL